MYLLQKACKKIKGCPYGRDLDFTKKVVSRLGQKEFFYMRDYTKSGMTIPHQVQRAVLQGFYRRRPDLGNKAARFYEDQQLYIKDSVSGEWVLHRPDTGSPLGLFVEGYTILQYAIHEMNLRDLPYSSSHFLFSATNDDMVVANDFKDELEAYRDVDVRTNSLLSMSYKDTKSGISRGRFVYCEEYWIDFDLASKESLFSVALIGAKQCYSAFHAKEYVYAVLLNSGGITPGVEAALREVQAAVGWEFHEDEFNWPFMFGGWLPCIESGLDVSIKHYNGDLKQIAGYWAARSRLSKKGGLDDRGHLAISRKYDLKLLEESKNIPNWVDLVPFFGSKRTLERHYRKAHSQPRSILRDYEILSGVRRSTYNKIIKGEQEYPPVLEGYLTRHPNSYWLDAMPGVKVTDPLTRINRPRYGFATPSLDMKLAMMQKKGYLSMNRSRVVGGTILTLAGIGITEQCRYSYLPISSEGISAQVLTTQPKGLLDFYERTGKVPLSLGEGDAPLKETMLWGWMPWASLLTTHRMWTWAKGQAYPMNEATCQVLGDHHRRISIRESLAHEAREFETTYSTGEDSSALEFMVRDVIRDWVLDTDEIMASLRDRIIPLVDSDNPLVSHVNALVLDEDPFTLGPSGGLRDGDEDGSQRYDSDEIYDPWSELG